MFPSQPSRTLVIMAKAPKPGMVKTRLTDCLSSPAATELYRCLLDDTLALANSLTGVEVAMMCPEPDREELVYMLGNRIRIVAQEGDGLAAGLTSVFRRFTSPEGRLVIAFNSDSPHLPSSNLESAFGILATHDVVIGPTHDGGYYLVGAKAAHASLFESDAMGTKSALEQLLTRTKALELSTGFAESFYDIDIASDLTRLAAELRLAPTRAPRTAAWLKEWERATSRLRTGAGSS